ncbi:hypothetical protein MHTCC0001_31050 [Flavobacteriaceae bacterium MHTCC 0001]
MNKYKKLAVGLLLDAMGYISFSIPGIGEFTDVVWAPIAAYLMTKLYKGRTGKIAAAVAFLEEMAPGLDVLPTFTLMWLFTYIFKPKETIVEV